MEETVLMSGGEILAAETTRELQVEDSRPAWAPTCSPPHGSPFSSRNSSKAV